MAPDYLSLWRWIGSNAIGRIARTQINQMVMVGSDGEVRFIAAFFYRSAPACTYLTTADANLLLVFPGNDGLGAQSRYPRTLLREG
jgi:hypothetical protein